jgi:gluconolactonase
MAAFFKTRQPVGGFDWRHPMKERMRHRFLERIVSMRWLMALMFLACEMDHLLAQDGDSLVAPGAQVEKIGEGMKFTEGPVWLPDRSILVFSDIPNSKWMQWSEAKGLSVYRDSQQANGNILDEQGRIIACQHAARNVVRLEADGSQTVLADRFDGKRFNSPNDAALRSDGSLWFTDPPWGLEGPAELPGHWVFRLDLKSGKVEPVIKDLAMPNGIVFSPDEKRLYVADTGGHPKHPDPAFHKLPASVRCYEIDAAGGLGKMVWTIDAGSDGMAMDQMGNLYTTHGKHVIVYDPSGKERERIEFPEGPANCTFGGDDGQTLFVTARTSLYRIRMKVAGMRPSSTP